MPLGLHLGLGLPRQERKLPGVGGKNQKVADSGRGTHRRLGEAGVPTGRSEAPVVQGRPRAGSSEKCHPIQGCCGSALSKCRSEPRKDATYSKQLHRQRENPLSGS